MLLQCNWTDELSSKESGYLVPLPPGFHNVRNRPWTLRHLGAGAVYNVKIDVINFKHYAACFDRVDVLADEVMPIRPGIFKIPTQGDAHGELWPQDLTHDLETLISDPPEGCDLSQYTDKNDPLRVTIPVAVTYEDKHRTRYRVRYLFSYECWFHGGRMTRISGVEKI